jgi:hypothetical protein
MVSSGFTREDAGVFASPPHHKTVILSAHRLSRDTALDGAESKDPEGACLTYAIRSFSTTEKKLNLIGTINP